MKTLLAKEFFSIIHSCVFTRGAKEFFSIMYGCVFTRGGIKNLKSTLD